MSGYFESDPSLFLDPIHSAISDVDSMRHLLNEKCYALNVWCQYWTGIAKQYKEILDKPWQRQYKARAAAFMQILDRQKILIEALDESVEPWNIHRQVGSTRLLRLNRYMVDLIDTIIVFIIPMVEDTLKKFEHVH